MAKLKTLSKADIFSCKDLPVTSVEVPEWGGQLFVRKISAGEVVDLSKINEDAEKVVVRGVILFACDADGIRVFEAEDEEMLLAKCPEALNRVFQAGLKVNGFGSDAIEDLKKNSEETDTFDS